MAALGGISVDILRGVPEPARAIYEPLVRPGADGHGLRQNASIGQPTTLEATTYTASGSWASHRAAMQALEGTTVTITDAWGVSHTKCTVVSVTLRALQTVQLVVSGSLAARYRAVWDVLVRRQPE